jgi:hypothetical protein
MTHRRFYRAEQLAVALVLSAVGWVYVTRLVWREIGTALTLPRLPGNP